ncbi:hypothetical protein NO559_07875 [Dasania sp. GY-MA-18]|uniref:DUF7673 domain-containing protein n=1 Tax=Dasania phycosphaerae TaxID=2950436 RepID=A0A9J6RL43_9GAMM|nr:MULTISPECIES: hypothetical protein [Dasania]MCR8922684.1 hypothetical protein [Dasania sp. GY-MA-18]MCZ0865114.1 hypothetical protein [Dasania phycosphaerae]MCZ0868840.1 hypothetical protein [Dasania phycosphaerae]
MKLVTAEQYLNAVSTLVALEQKNTQGSRAAAQVLLSACEGEQYPLAVTDLCLLDEFNYLAALQVISGRVQFLSEPYKLLRNGKEIFKTIRDRWPQLHVVMRAELIH